MKMYCVVQLLLETRHLLAVLQSKLMLLTTSPQSLYYISQQLSLTGEIH